MIHYQSKTTTQNRLNLDCVHTMTSQFETAKNVTDRPPVSTKTAHVCRQILKTELSPTRLKMASCEPSKSIEIQHLWMLSKEGSLIVKVYLHVFGIKFLGRLQLVHPCQISYRFQILLISYER